MPMLALMENGMPSQWNAACCTARRRRSALSSATSIRQSSSSTPNSSPPSRASTSDSPTALAARGRPGAAIVTCGMSIGIVDQLELVQIDKQQAWEVSVTIRRLRPV
jgi:hypothetical protein